MGFEGHECKCLTTINHLPFNSFSFIKTLIIASDIFYPGLVTGEDSLNLTSRIDFLKIKKPDLSNFNVKYKLSTYIVVSP